MPSSNFKPGNFIVHVTGGPVHVVKFETSTGDIHCERWSGAVFLKETFSPETIRLAKQSEIDAMQK